MLSEKQLHIILPALVRRTMQAFALKAKIRESGAELIRIGRSRNWQLKASREQLEIIIYDIESSEQETWHWIAEKLRTYLAYNTFESLVALAKRKSGITVAELMAKSNCTTAEARKVIDAIEFNDDE